MTMEEIAAAILDQVDSSEGKQHDESTSSPALKEYTGEYARANDVVDKKDN